MRTAVLAIALVATACTGGSGSTATTVATTGPPPPAVTTTAGPPPSVATTTSIFQIVLTPWQEDLAFLVERIEAIHPSPYHRTDQTRLLAIIRELTERFESATDSDALLGIMELVARFDGHTQVPLFQTATGFQAYPLRFYEFPDGVYLVDAPEEHAAVVGGRLVSVGGTPVDELLGPLFRLASHDNEHSVDLVVAGLLANAGILEALGVVADPAAPGYVVRPAAGPPVTIDVAPIPGDPSAFNVTYNVGLPQRDEPLALRHRDATMWWTALDGGRAVYLQLNQTQPNGPNDAGEFVSLAGLVDEIQDAIAAGGVDRLIVDLRHNFGGNNTTYGPLLELAQEFDAARPGRLFVIIGRQTFSAAANLATEIDLTTGATFVGEPTGGKPNLFGDPRAVTLPNSGLRVLISTRYWEIGGPGDFRLAIEPDIPAPLTIDDFLAGRDPALEAALAAPG